MQDVLSGLLCCLLGKTLSEGTAVARHISELQIMTYLHFIQRVCLKLKYFIHFRVLQLVGILQLIDLPLTTISAITERLSIAVFTVHVYFPEWFS